MAGNKTERRAITIIVARAANGVIGANNKLPWHLPEELKYFKSVTMGHALIMGRKTFESIGRPLPGRRMIVVTRNSQWAHDGCKTANSLPAAIQVASEPDPIVTHTDQIFVAGGVTIYAEAMPLANRLLITQVDLQPDGDTFLDAPDPTVWKCVSRDEQISKNGVSFCLQDWRLKKNSD